MPEISRFFGIIIAMFGDDHNPPHFHVRYGDYRCTVTISKGVVKGQLPRKALKKVFEWMDEHHDELMARSTLSLCLQRTGHACSRERTHCPLTL